MKKKENKDNQQSGAVKRPRIQIWKLTISLAVCIAFASVIVLGVFAFQSNGKIAALQQENSSLKNGQTQTGSELDLIKNENQSLSQRLDALEAANQGLLQEIEKLKEQLQISEDEKIRIYIDQGHNPVPYHNSGAEGNGLYEHELTFIIGCALADILKADGRFEVCLSRPNKGVVLGTDNASSQQARVDGAEAFEADYLISLHINSYTDGTPNGIEVYTIEDGTASYAFGESLLEGLVGATGLRDRGMKQDLELYILKNATMPAALLEMGFISNSEDAAVLASSPELFAQGIYDGILDYFGFSPRNTEAN